MNHEVKKDCFGYMVRTMTCGVLKETFCKKEDCSFYKTKEQFELEREKYPMKKKEIKE